MKSSDNDLEFQLNVKAFKDNFPHLMREHAGEFVAISQGKVLGFDNDQRKLFERVRNQSTGHALLIQPIKPIEVGCVDTLDM